jgi:5-formyltetrahydrofolate cyclo-ligase
MRDKSELRHELAARRAAAFGAEPDAVPKLIAHFPLSIDVSGQTVAGYMPFRTEINVLPLMRALAHRGGYLSLPRMNNPSLAPFPTKGGRGEALHFHLCDIEDPSQFVANKWGLLEPHSHLPTATPTILLIPLLGFDRQGNRLGYGKGYYDQTILALRREDNITTIGVAFSQQEVPKIPTQPHDQRLDWIITQNEAYRIPS